MRKLHVASFVSPLVVLTAFLLPLFFLPSTSDLFDTNKRFLIFAVTLLVVGIGAIQMFVKKEIRLTRTPWTLPIALFGISSALTVFLISPNKVQALVGSGGLYIAFSLLFLTCTSLIRKNITKQLINGLSGAALVVTLTSLLDRLGVNFAHIANSIFGLALPAGTHLYITGSPLFSVFFLSLVAILLTIRFFQTKGANESLMHATFALICILGIGANALSLTPSSPTYPQFLSTLDSWSVATDVLKTPLNAVLGVGTDSYANAFSIFKPVRLNQSPLWFVRFNNARNSFLELLVTQGILGMLAWTLIFIMTIRFIRTTHGDQLVLSIGSLFIEILLVFFPPNVLLIGLLAIFLIAWSASLKEHEVHTKETLFSFFSFADPHTTATHPMSAQYVAARLLACVILIATVGGMYGIGRAYMGEYFFNRSLISANKGNGKDTYDFAIRAINANPYMETYHRAFAITNLTLARAISQNKNLSDQDKQNVLTLIQQAIQQAKIATTLDPLDTANWDTLTTVYQSLIGMAEGANQWTIASFVEQIKTDPSNPQVRFNMGSAYRQTGNNDLAMKLYEQAAQLKPDYANAYFNMADLYKKKGDKQNELAMLQATLALIKPDQNGYANVKNEIDQLHVAAPAPTPEPTPTPTATSAANVSLPTDAGLPTTNTVPEVPKK